MIKTIFDGISDIGTHKYQDLLLFLISFYSEQ